MLGVHSGHDLEDLTVARIVCTLQLFVHLQRFLEQTDCVPVVACLHVALAQLVQNVGVVVSRLSHALEQLAIDLECVSQVLERLLVPFEGQVGLTELRVGDHKQEDALVVDVDEDFAEREAVDSRSQHLFQVSLRLRVYLKRI